MFRVLTAFVAFVAFSTSTWADESSMGSEKPHLFSSQSAVVSAMVEAINHETREVTIKRADGEVVSFIASEEARNLDQVNPGDIVLAELVQTMSIQVMAGEGAAPAQGEMTSMARTDKGEMPGLAALSSRVVTATVEDINLEMNTFKLKGPNGEVKEYKARDPENLKKADVGDLVVITFTEAVAITVEKAEAQ
jgi:hypothetical protein